MKYLKEKIRDGVISLKEIPTYALIQMCEETDCPDEKNILGDEIMYRDDTKHVLKHGANYKIFKEK